MQSNTQLATQNAQNHQSHKNYVMQRRLQQSMKQKFWTQVNTRDKQLFDDFIPFGLAFFSNHILQKHNLHLFPKKISQALQNPNWQIAANSHDDSIMWEKRLELIRECQASNLEIKIGQQYFQCFIFKSIEPIVFPELLVLSLYSCKINNIEILNHINAPKLRSVNLIYNQIFTFKSLAKSNFPLKSLHLISTNQTQSRYRNNRHYFGNFAHTIKNSEKPRAFIENFQRQNFSLVNLGLQKHVYNSVGANDLSFLAKGLPRSKNEQLCVNVTPRIRIRQKHVIEALNMVQIKMVAFFNNGQDLPVSQQGLYRQRY